MKILITGVSGQDGSNMVDFLLKNTEHDIIGTIRSLSNSDHENIRDYLNNSRFSLISMDLTDETSISVGFRRIMPDYFINFAAQSSVIESWKQPKLTFMTNTISIVCILELIKEFKPSCRFYSAGSSEEFGNIEVIPQTLIHPLKPTSIYGASKCAARHIVKVYRESFNLFAIHCILYNHEGIKRNKQFVTRKITYNLAKIKVELENGIIPTPFQLGNINVRRDWSDSEDFVEAIWLMITKDTPGEYILSSNTDHSIKDFIDIASNYLNLNIIWNIDENNPLKTTISIDNHIIVTISNDLYRPLDLKLTRGNNIETCNQLNWKPKVDFEQMIKKMVDHDYKLLRLQM